MSAAVFRKAKTALKLAAFQLSHRDLFRAHPRFRDRHKGERVFILCNGPSVLKQDLLPLRNEIVMTVSSGYLHKDFAAIRPRYHFVPPVTYGRAQPADVIQWFEEMDRSLGEAELFLGSTEYELVQAQGLFKTRQVNYLCCALPFWPRKGKILDLRWPLPATASVPIMCLIVALYMGFRDIYLLGTDHDAIVTRRYTYSFEPTVLRGKDRAVDEAGRMRVPLYEWFKANLQLWGQYRRLKEIALNEGRNIYNASAGGMLDEFPRVDLAQLFGDGAPRADGS